MSVNYTEELNKSQQEAVFYNEGPSLIIAGAGAGKTRVLIYKISYLLEQGYKPWNILALTFTNKAAEEMKVRIAAQVGEKTARYLWMGTFHSVFSRILRNEAPLIGFKQNFTIYDQSDSRSLTKSIIKEMQLDDKVYKPNAIQERISSAKSRLILASDYAANSSYYNDDRMHRIPAFRNIYATYCNRLHQANAMDFDDLLVNTHLLFEQHPEVCAKYAEQFKYVLVDEYQDTNYTQHSIVWQLTHEHKQVCVVGDDAQSIYSFRGADIDNILKFTSSYQRAKLFKLEQNYRSTQMIVNAANSLIAKNSEQIPKEVYSHREQGKPIALIKAYSDVEEGEAVANKIQELHHGEKLSYNGFAILYRTNAQSRIFEEALRKRAIPYRIYGGLSFYQRKEIKDVIAYFRLAVNPLDEEALKRVINYPARGIGDTTLTRVIETATDKQVSLWEVVSNPERYELPVSKGIAARLLQFASLIATFIEDALTRNAYEVARSVVQASSIGKDIYADSGAEDIARQENVNELLNAISDFCLTRQEEGDEADKLNDFLSQVALLSDQDRDKTGEEERVTLMTMHSAKGLEYGAVFVVGMEENLFPSPMCTYNERGVEEERRLFYVAITRAEQYCFLSFAKSRYRYGKFEFCEPSRFLKDIDTRYMQLPRDERGAKKTSQSLFGSTERAMSRPAADRFEAAAPSGAPRNLHKMEHVSFVEGTGAGEKPLLAMGQVIEHVRFGIGDVVAVEGVGDNAKATISFRNVGVKVLLLKFAQYKVIS